MSEAGHPQLTGGAPPRWKRPVDLMGAAAGLVLLAPLMVLIAAVVRLGLGRPVLFRQVRPGLHHEPFTIYKFRTMTDRRGVNGEPLPDSRRLTAIGRLLRRTSLDELPELINVLKGDMSLVGPRPLLMEYLPLYTEEQARRHELRPGITGLAQVEGRNALPWEERFRLDVHYVDHVSPWLDLKILLKTLKRLVDQRGVNQPGEATVRYFSDVVDQQ